MLPRFRHSEGARPEQQVTFAHNIPFYSHYLQAPVASRPAAPCFVPASPRPFLRAGKKPSLKPEESPAHFQHDPFFHYDSHETTATKGNAIEGHTAHHIHIDAGAEITVFIDNPLSQR